MDIAKEYGNARVECRWQGTLYFVDPRIFHEVLFLQENGPMRFVRPDTGCRMFDMSKNTFEKFARAANAVHKEDGTKLIDLHQVTRYIESLGPEG